MIEQFRKDFLYYFLGIIIPGLANFLAIPVFKSMLGDANFGQFNLLFTALVILNTAMVGWVGQSLIRLGMQANDKESFMGHGLWVSMIIILGTCIPAVAVLWMFNTPGILILLFVAVLIATSQQVTLVAISQAFFRSRLTLYTEATRAVLFFLTGFLLLKFTGNRLGVQKLFLALLVSNFTSIYILLHGNALFAKVTSAPAIAEIRRVMKLLLHYGFYLLLWFLLNYAIMFIDRYLIALVYGNEMAGHYSAIFDIISRSISLLGMPVLAATFPLITREYERGNHSAITGLLRTTIMLEALALGVGLIAYFVFGFSLLQQILSLPSQTNEYLLPGALILAGSVIGQIGMLLHKRLELAKKTSLMLRCVGIAFAVCLSSNLLLIKTFGILGTSFSYLLGTGTYAMAVWITSRHFRRQVDHPMQAPEFT